MSAIASARAQRRWDIRVDWPNCYARGLCHELLPEVIDLDEWGYPIVNAAVTADLLADAREAVRTCPTLALRLNKTQM